MSCFPSVLLYPLEASKGASSLRLSQSRYHADSTRLPHVPSPLAFGPAIIRIYHQPASHMRHSDAGSQVYVLFPSSRGQGI